MSARASGVVARTAGTVRAERCVATVRLSVQRVAVWKPLVVVVLVQVLVRGARVLALVRVMVLQLDTDAHRRVFCTARHVVRSAPEVRALRNARGHLHLRRNLKWKWNWKRDSGGVRVLAIRVRAARLLLPQVAGCRGRVARHREGQRVWRRLCGNEDQLGAGRRDERGCRVHVENGNGGGLEGGGGWCRRGGGRARRRRGWRRLRWQRQRGHDGGVARVTDTRVHVALPVLERVLVLSNGMSAG